MEYSLRALSNATNAKGRYFRKIKERLDGEENSALAALEAIKGKLPADSNVVKGALLQGGLSGGRFPAVLPRHR